jgi:hypothetical protein
MEENSKEPAELKPRDIKVYPFFIKATVILFGLILFCYTLHVLAPVLVPFAFAGLLAILLNPVANRFQLNVKNMLKHTIINHLYYGSTNQRTIAPKERSFLRQMNEIIILFKHW